MFGCRFKLNLATLLDAKGRVSIKLPLIFIPKVQRFWTLCTPILIFLWNCDLSSLGSRYVQLVGRLLESVIFYFWLCFYLINLFNLIIIITRVGPVIRPTFDIRQITGYPALKISRISGIRIVWITFIRPNIENCRISGQTEYLAQP